MAKNQQEKSKAEIYREERKDRLAKAQKGKRQSSSIGVNKSSGRTNLKKVIAVVVVVVILFTGWLLSFLGVPQRMKTVMSVGNEKVSQSEFAFYYRSVYLQYIKYAQQMAQYGMGGDGMYDPKKLPSDQEYTDDGMPAPEDGSKLTWQDFFTYTAKESAAKVKILVAMAEKDGFKLSDEKTKEVNDSIEEAREELKTVSDNYPNGQTVNVYLRNTFGSGMNEKLWSEIMMRQQIANSYLEEKGETIADELTNAELEHYVNENQGKFLMVDMNSYKFAYAEGADDAAKAQVKATAEKMLAEVTTSDKFLAVAKEFASKADLEKLSAAADSTLAKGTIKDTLTTNLGLKPAAWLFAGERVAGDKAVIEGDDGVYVILLNKTAYKDDGKTVNVRHILVSLEKKEEVEGEEKTVTRTKEETIKIAEEIFAKWKTGAATEDSFAELAKEFTEDPGSKETGGLYEGVATGKMVAEFDAWIFDKDRKVGDTAIVNTTHGAHIMFFVGVNEETVWQSAAREEVTKERTENLVEEAKKTDEYKVVTKDKKIDSIATKNSKTYI